MSTTPRFRPPTIPDPYLAAIRGEIAARRTLLGWSPERLSQEAGLSSAAVRQIESGRSAPTLGTLVVVAGALGCRVADLIPEPKKKSGKS